MPLFFLLSGFLSYAVYTRQLMARRIKNRLSKQLLPTIVVYMIFLYLFEQFRVGWNFKYRGFSYYWFTVVVVEYFMTYMAMECAVRKFKINRTLSYIGKYTLEIYLWHYIVIWSLRPMTRAYDFTAINATWLVQFIVYLALAITVVCACLLMANVAKIAPPIYRLCFGQFKN